MNENINRVSEAFSTSNAPLSRRLCNDLDSMGPMGQLASLLFKAEKARKQANSYSGEAPVSRRQYRDYSQDRLREMLIKTVCLLDAHAKAMGVDWGWRIDDKSDSPTWLLCIELPTGQVTYRLSGRCMGPEYELGSEGDSRNSDRITRLCADVLDGSLMDTEEDPWE